MTRIEPDWRGARVLVVGDLILDRYCYGTVQRISPEAPVPVLDVNREELVPGGAANVAHNIRHLGGEAVLIGVTGDDRYGEIFLDVLSDAGIESDGVVEVPDRITTVKTRVVAHQQQVVRVDSEVRTPIPPPIREMLLRHVEEEAPYCKAVVASDYAKGVFAPTFLADVARVAKSVGIPYIVDPKPIHFPYPGATVITPNREEASALFGRPFSADEIDRVAAKLFEATDWEAILFTLGPEGMAVAERGSVVDRIPAKVREVFDVTGAGDTVVAVVALGKAVGMPLGQAARLANIAGGVVVGKVGTAICSFDELHAACRETQD